MTTSVLIPTYERPEALAMTLSGVATQTIEGLHVVISSQGSFVAEHCPTIQAIARIITAKHGTVRFFHRMPRGIAEQRHFLLEQSVGEYCLYLDDDVLMEPWVVSTLERVILQEDVAFVGAHPAGLKALGDHREDEENIEFWHDRVEPERVDIANSERWRLHRAANLYHVEQRMWRESAMTFGGRYHVYKIDWVGACVMYDREKLISVGGFSFWKQLGRHNKAEDVLVQRMLMARWGGCGMMPSGTYHAEIPSTRPAAELEEDASKLDLSPEQALQ